MSFPTEKEVLTTGEVAKICHVAPRTVSKWFDSGKLRGYRIPGSRDRRIPVQQLVAFMRAHGMPLDILDGGVCRIMILDNSVPEMLVDAMNSSNHYEVQTASNEFEAGVLAQQFRPHAIILDADTKSEEAVAICVNIKTSAELQATKVIATADNLTDKRTKRLLEEGFDACLAKPFGQAELVAAIENATNLIG